MDAIGDNSIQGDNVHCTLYSVIIVVKIHATADLARETMGLTRGLQERFDDTVTPGYLSVTVGVIGHKLAIKGQLVNARFSMVFVLTKKVNFKKCLY